MGLLNWGENGEKRSLIHEGSSFFGGRAQLQAGDGPDAARTAMAALADARDQVLHLGRNTGRGEHRG